MICFPTTTPSLLLLSCPFYSISSFSRWDKKNAILHSRHEKYHYLYSCILLSVLLIVPLPAERYLSMCFPWLSLSTDQLSFLHDDNSFKCHHSGYKITSHLPIYFVNELKEIYKLKKKKECKPQEKKIEEKKVFLLLCWPKKNLPQRSQFEEIEHWINCKR